MALLKICAYPMSEACVKDKAKCANHIGALIYYYFDRYQILEVVSGRRDPASSILVISALMHLHDMYKAESNMVVPASVKSWSHLHDFIELNHPSRSTSQEWGGKYRTLWHMARSILRGFPEAGSGYRHPNLYHDPPCCKDGERPEMPCMTHITGLYWKRILKEKKPHEDIWPGFHNSIEWLAKEDNVPCPGYCRYAPKPVL